MYESEALNKCTIEFAKRARVEKHGLFLIPTDFNFLFRLSGSFCFFKD